MNEGYEPATVSAVIPTTGRLSTLDAVASVLAQTLKSVEAIVVFDGPAGERELKLPDDPRVRLVTTAHRSGPGAARALGIEMARGRFIAFLDDDDRWLPQKLEAQLKVLGERIRPRPYALVSSRVIVVDTAGREQLLIPRRVIARGQSVADYLFKRREVRFGEALLHPSTLLCEREVAMQIAWKGNDIHEDWDWLLRLTERTDVEVVMTDAPLTIVTETSGSASRAGNWQGSLEWVTENRSALSDREWADFLLCVTAPYAKAAGHRRVALQLAYQAMRFGKPGVPALAFFTLYQAGPNGVLTRLARVPGRTRLMARHRLESGTH